LRRLAACRTGERGSGVVSATWGLVFFLGFLLLAVQVATDLYWQSQVRLVAFDAARRAAEAGDAEATGDAVIDSLLGPSAGRSWSVGDDAVSVRITVPRSNVVVRIWSGDDFTASATVRRERFRP
jgi:type IV secretory pathway TrbF-like protein